jgi:ribosomal protein S18 acetylase RimI-like enzyme
MSEEPKARITVEAVGGEKLKLADFNDLCDIALDTIAKGGGFGGWLKVPSREVMERYWRGVQMIPERTLLIGRVDGAVAAAVQLVRPSRTNELSAHAATLTGAFVAEWARGQGLARLLTLAAEDMARKEKFRVLNLDLRATHEAATLMYERLGYKRWGVHPLYAVVEGKVISGYYYCKDLNEPATDEAAP